MTKLITGLVAAPFTPMHANGDINLSIIDQYVNILLDQDVKNVFVNGSTGEGPSLTTEERKRTAEKWIQSGKNKLDNVIIHVGSTSVRESQELARHAESCGADMISSLPPFYYKPATVDLLVDYLAEVASAAPSLPFLYYHIPAMTGVTFSMLSLITEAEKRIPNFGGMKFTSGDLPDLLSCVDKFGNTLNFCQGKEEVLVFALSLGCNSAVGSTFNFAGKIASKILKASQSGDKQGSIKGQVNAQRMFEVLFKHGYNTGVAKTLMEAVTGLPVGPPRLPLCAPSKKEVDGLVSDLKSIGFFEQRK